jgi:glycosyltransferase involved in cell wall biosynthesis
VVTEHVGHVPYASRFIEGVERVAWRTAGRFVISSARAVAACNARVLDWLVDGGVQVPAEVIANGVDCAVFHPSSGAEKGTARARLGLPQGESLVLFVGRQSEKKNLEALLGFERCGYRLVVCGAKRNLPDDVIDLGVIPHSQMPAVFAASDLMVHAATGEGFPIAVQEAMAAGLPLVLLWDEGYARLLSREAIVACSGLQEIPAAIAALLADPTARAEAGARARLWAEQHWSWERTAAAYERLYARAREGA